MKKIIIMLLSMTLIVVCLVVQVFSADVTDEYDEYVFCELGNIITAYGGIDQDNVTVGTGIDVYNSRNEIRFYPVYICGNLEYILELYKENSIIGFAFSPNSAQAIDETIELSNGRFSVFSIDDHLYGNTGNEIIDFSTLDKVELKEFMDQIPQVKEYNRDNIQFRKSIDAKDINTKNNRSSSWTTYYYITNYGKGCVPLTLYNIYKNNGNNPSSWQSIRGDMNYVNGLSTSNFEYNHSQIQTYLSSIGADTTYYSSMGKLPFSTCSTIISNGKYIMAISATYTFELGMYHVRGYHATAIIDTPSTNVLKMFDPHGSSSTVIISNINYYSPSFTSGGLVYTWDSGYYSYLTY